VAATDPRMAHLIDIDDVSEFELLEIHHFFQVYKQLEPGKMVEAGKWADRAAADAEILACRSRLARAEGRDH
jgi:inorganic pyrophosphatase